MQVWCTSQTWQGVWHQHTQDRLFANIQQGTANGPDAVYGGPLKGPYTDPEGDVRIMEYLGERGMLLNAKNTHFSCDKEYNRTFVATGVIPVEDIPMNDAGADVQVSNDSPNGLLSIVSFPIK